MKKLLIAGVAAAAFYSAPALAGPPPSVFNWSGFYLGGNGGYGWADDSIDHVSGFFTGGGARINHTQTHPKGGIGGEE
jgi:outer membrane immunogenic protein